MRVKTPREGLQLVDLLHSRCLLSGLTEPYQTWPETSLALAKYCGRYAQEGTSKFTSEFHQRCKSVPG